MNFSRVGSALEARVLGWVDVNRYLPLQLDITNACNLRCSHCYHPHHRNEGALSLQDWVNIVFQYKTLIARLKYKADVVLCGGEPLLSPFLIPLIDSILQELPAARISILSNGTLVTKLTQEFLEKHRSNIRFQISVDGPDASSHDQVRGLGAFEKAKTGAAFLLERGFSVSLLAVLSKKSAGNIPAFFDTAKEWGVRQMGFTRLILQGQAKTSYDKNIDRPLEPLELRDAYISILENSLRTQVQSRQASSPLMHLIHPKLGRSGRFWEGLVIDYQGYFLASSRSRLKLGNIHSDTLESILLRHPLLKKIRRGEIEKCGSCPHFRNCGGDRNAAYASTGNYLGADPGCWLNLNHKGA